VLRKASSAKTVGNWDRRPANGKVIIMFPKESARVILMPHDPPVTVRNAWYCKFFWSPSMYNGIAADIVSGGTGVIGSGSAAKTLKDILTDMRRKKYDAVSFFRAEQPKTVKVNPGRGQTITKTWKNCYTKHQLNEAMKDIRAWTDYMRDTWLPEHGVKM